MEPEPRPTSSEGRTRDAIDFWVEHARTASGVTAVEPRIRMHGYHAWSRQALRRWTIGRLRRDRAWYRLGVDLGCGNGEWTEHIAPLCQELYASDVSPEFVVQTRTRTAAHPACRVVVSDIRSAEIPEGADLVYVGAVLMYCSDREVRDVLKRVRARAAPRAHVVIRDWCTYNFGRRTEHAHGSIHRSAGDLRRFAEDAGLRCVEQRSSFSIYGELAAGAVPGLQWPLRALLRLATLPWTRASHTLRFYA